MLNEIYHCHTEYSLKDSAMSPETLVKTASEMGAKSIALTDHGTLMGVYPFMDACKKYGVKGIPGVEAYIEEDEDFLRRRHLCIVPKNYEGYKAICKAVTESNKRQRYKIPRMNMDILTRCFGPNSTGHGNVIASSACIGGVISQVYLLNASINNEIGKLKQKQEDCENPNSEKSMALMSKMDDLEEKLEEVSQNIKNAKKTSKIPTKAKENSVLRALNGGDSGKIEKAKLELDKILQLKADAEKQLVTLTRQHGKISSEYKRLKEELKALGKTFDKYESLQNKINMLSAKIASSEQIEIYAQTEVEKYQNIFGVENFYIEIQYHRIPAEKEVMPKLCALSDITKAPLVVANDVHYAQNDKHSILGRTLNMAQRYNDKKIVDWFRAYIHNPDVGYDQYYIKTDEELKSILEEIIDEKYVKRGFEGARQIVAQCNVAFPQTLHYPKYNKLQINETSKQRLRSMAISGISERYPLMNGWTQAHVDRLEYELDIIDKMGYNDYHLIVADFLEFARNIDKQKYNTVLVGPGRGSAAGSLVCYLIGITNIDPLEYGLLFERYLNPERVSMPDIDCDFAPTIRPRAYEYLKQVYGNDAICSIGTETKQLPKAAIRTVGRILSGDYEITANRMTKEIPDTAKESFNQKISEGSPETLKQHLLNVFSSDAHASRILELAETIAGSIITVGTHSAGVIIADNYNVSDYIPLRFDGETWSSQCSMAHVEKDAGLLKVDLLGLTYLNIITTALELIYNHHGKVIDLYKVDRNDPRVLRGIFSKGITGAVFQFESEGMKDSLKRFKPSSFGDLVLLDAAYRPGPMQYISDLIEVKHGRKSVTYISPILEDILKDTYGKPIYQEQVMLIFRNLAGYSFGRADLVRRAMAKKKADVLEAERMAFIYGDERCHGCLKNGVRVEDANKLFDELTAFAKYAFNKSHATAYTLISYWTAWLKYYYPTEYYTSAMRYTEEADKRISYIGEAKQYFRIETLPPDINKSGIEFTGRDRMIRFGLKNIRNVGNEGKLIVDIRQQNSNGGFSDIFDFLSKVPIQGNSFESLADAGCFDTFDSNRLFIKEVFKSVKPLYKKIFEKRKVIDELQKRPDAANNQKLIDNALTTIKKLQIEIQESIPLHKEENFIDRCEKEKDLLGFFVTFHPLDEYEVNSNFKTCDISNASQNVDKRVSMIGILDNIQLRRRKKDNKPFAFADLSDKTSSINCLLTAKVCAENNNFDDIGVKPIIVRGTIKLDKDQLKLIVDNVELVPAPFKKVYLSVENANDWAQLHDVILEYADPDGKYELFIYDVVESLYKQCDVKTVNSQILKDARLSGKIYERH